MIKLFISYRSLDSAKVDAIVARLKTLTNPDGTPRYQIWQDKTGIRPAQDWWEAIVDAIIDCNVFVFMMSHESVKNTNCRAELNYARRRNRPVLPVVLEGEYVYNSITGKNDVSYGADIPDDLTDLRTQYLFYDGPAALQKFENAVTALQAEARRWIDLEAPRPRDPRDSDVNNSAIALYAEACDYAYRLELATADRLFRRLIAADDPDFYEPARIWVDLLRDYQELLELDARQSTRYAFKSRWERYAAQFPQSFIEGIFDPKRLGERVSDSGEQTAPGSSVAPLVDAPVTPVPLAVAIPDMARNRMGDTGNQQRLRQSLIGISILVVGVLVVGLLASQGAPSLLVAMITVAMIYVALALPVAYINNLIAQTQRWREATLWYGIQDLLGDPGIHQEFVHHPLIRMVNTTVVPGPKGIQQSRRTGVTYIPPERFADVLLRILLVNGERGADGSRLTEDPLLVLRRGVEQVVNAQLRETLNTILLGVQNLQEAKAAFQHWFVRYIEDVAQGYTQRMAVLSLVVALALCLTFNVDVLQIGALTFNASNVIEETRIPFGWSFTIPDESCASSETIETTVAVTCKDSRNLLNFLPGNNIFWSELLVSKILGLLGSAIFVSILAPVVYTILRRITGT